MIMAGLTKEAVTRVIGRADDSTVAALSATGANEAELREAHAWVMNDDVLIDELRPLPSQRVAALIDILGPLEGIEDEDVR